MLVEAELAQEIQTPRDAHGTVNYDLGWKLWSDCNRYYPSAVHRRRLIVGWLAPLKPATVLDVGCGPGVTLAHLRGRLPDARFVGCDTSQATIIANRRKFPWARSAMLDIGVDRPRRPLR